MNEARSGTGIHLSLTRDSASAAAEIGCCALASSRHRAFLDWPYSKKVLQADKNASCQLGWFIYIATACMHAQVFWLCFATHAFMLCACLRGALLPLYTPEARCDAKQPRLCMLTLPCMLPMYLQQAGPPWNHLKGGANGMNQKAAKQSDPAPPCARRSHCSAP